MKKAGTVIADLMTSWPEYMVDAFQRSVLFLDLLRQCGNEEIEITSRPMATVLRFDHGELRAYGRLVVATADQLLLLCILPSPGIVIDRCKRPVCGIAVSGATDAARVTAAIVLMTPGLSVIINSMKESRKIFQRMNSYAIYRIAETLRALLFMTLSILIFNFYPLTAVMIVMLALLNDGAILSIAYDNVLFQDKPEAWNMCLVVRIATALCIVGPMAAFDLFYLGDRVFHLDRPHLPFVAQGRLT